VAINFDGGTKYPRSVSPALTVHIRPTRRLCTVRKTLRCKGKQQKPRDSKCNTTHLTTAPGAHSASEVRCGSLTNETIDHMLALSAATGKVYSVGPSHQARGRHPRSAVAAVDRCRCC